MKRTYQPKSRQRIRKHGWRNRSKNAIQVLKRRMLKGRWKLAVTATTK